jgi:uncharacterized protein YbaR (Trm112 family)
MIIDDGAEIPACPRCGHRLEIDRLPEPEALPECLAPGNASTIDGFVLSWLMRPTDLPARASRPDSECPACGYAGLMSLDSDQGDLICPACLQAHRTKQAPVRTERPCPHCGRAIELREKDRGKTIVCPDCKYFLGCLLLPEKHKHWRMGTGASHPGK